jgi:hypothetical protein
MRGYRPAANKMSAIRTMPTSVTINLRSISSSSDQILWKNPT